MDSPIEVEVGQLRQMTTAQLRSKYRELFGGDSHSNHKPYLFRRVAWRLQTLAQGGLSERARQYAQNITQDADLRLCPPKNMATPPLLVKAVTQVESRLPAAGTVLVRRYKNDTIAVTVLDHGGFQYGERVYKSLSAIAREVTGTQWNGYSFFCLSSRKA